MTHAWAISVTPSTDSAGDSYWHAEIAEAFAVTYVRDYYTDWSAAEVAADMLRVVTAAERVWQS